MQSLLHGLCTEYGFASITEQLSAAVKNEILFATESVTGEGLPVGASRFGGMPDLPPEMAWPTFSDKSMLFLGQFRLKDVAPHDLDHKLPATGLLSANTTGITWQ